MTDNDYLIAYEREKAARLAAEKLLEELTEYQLDKRTQSGQTLSSALTKFQ